MKNELPKGGDINKCCFERTRIGTIKVKTRMMSNPPDTTDKLLVVKTWQCVIEEKHHGEVWSTTN